MYFKYFFCIFIFHKDIGALQLSGR